MIYDNQKREALELQIIVSILNIPDLYYQMEYKLKPDHFTGKYKTLYRSIEHASKIHGSLELSFVAEFFKDDNNFSFKKLIELINSAKPLKGNSFHSSCKVLIEYNLSLELDAIADEILNSSKYDFPDFTKAVDEFKARLNNVNVNMSTVDENMSEISISYKKKLIERMSKKDKNEMQGVSTAIENLNDFTGGWIGPDLIIAAARPGMGKTAYVVHNSIKLALSNVPSAIFCYEMSKEQLMDRYLSNMTKINSKKIMKGMLSQEEIAHVNDAVDRISTIPLHIYDKHIPLSGLLQKIKYLYYKYGIKIVFIDYLQLIVNDLVSPDASDNQKVGGITSALKQLCLELTIPIVLLSQLSRAVEKRASKKPQLSDLRDSGSIEQDADIVIFFFRPEYYKKVLKGFRNDGENLCQIFMAKGRAIGVSDFNTYFRKEFNHFKEWSN